MTTFIVRKNDVDCRLDNFLLKQYPSLKKSTIYKLIRNKDIKVNKKKTSFDYRLQLDDEISCYLKLEANKSKPTDLLFLDANNNLLVVYEDDNILVVNKPVNLIVYDEQNKKPDTLINRCLKYLYNKHEFDVENENSFKPYLAHRIDQNTSGLVIVAKNKNSLVCLNQIFKEFKIQKNYCCLVYGLVDKPKETIINFIKKENNNIVKVSNTKVSDEYKQAITSYELIKYVSNKYSLLDVEIKTGRTHQIRATMNFIKHPIVGEQKYINKFIDKDIRFNTQCLVSYKLRFLDLSGTYLEYLSFKEIKLNDIWFYKILKI